TVVDSTAPILNCAGNKTLECSDCFSGGSLEYLVLRNFSRVLSNGYFPSGGVVQGSDGYLYGTTRSTKPGPPGNEGYGVIFRILPDGSGYSLLRTFSSTDGSDPYAGVCEGQDGKLYGTTTGGGTSPNNGTVYRIDKNGSGFQTLHNFTGTTTDGASPY